MGIADLFRPKYRHSDVRVRTEAVRALTRDDADLLTQIARTDREPSVRRIAIEKIDEAEVLATISREDAERALRDLAGGRAAEIWTHAACGSGDSAGPALAGLIALGDQRAIAEVAARAAQADMRKRALAELREPKALAELARIATQPDVRLAAIGRITDRDVLRGLALDTSHKEVGVAAVERIDDAETLDFIVHKAKAKQVRQRAKKKLADIEDAARAARPAVGDDVKRRRAEHAQLLRQIEALGDTFEFQKSVDVVHAVETGWKALGPADDAAIEDRYQKAISRYYQRRDVHAHAHDHEQQIQAARDVREVESRARRETAQREAAERASRAEAARAEAPPDPAREARRLEAEARQAEREQKRVEFEAKKAAEAAERAARVKEDAERGKQLAVSLAALLDEMDQVGGSGDARATDRVLAQAQKAFEQIGKVPQPERDALSSRYGELRARLVIQVKDSREAEDWQRWANVPRQEALIKEALALVELDDVSGHDIGLLLKDLQSRWKQVGPAPQKKSKELWESFKAATDKAYERVKAGRDAEKEKWAVSAAAKEQLIAAAEALADSSDWEGTAQQLKGLQAQWKTSGPLPRKQGDELWKRFRASCDRFFERRKPVLDAQRAELDRNLEQKQAMCARAEAIVAGAPGEKGWGVAINEIKALQRDWRDIGFVPRRDADAVYARFRAACDALFAKRDEARDAEANARRAEVEGMRSEIEALAADASAEDAVARAVAVRGKLRELSEDAPPSIELTGLVDRMLRSVIAAHPEGVKGTELDPEAVRGRREKLLARAEALMPKDSPALSGAESPAELAAKLKSAMASNALGKLRMERDPVEVIDELRAEWQATGPVLDEAGEALRARFDQTAAAVLAAVGAEDRPRPERSDRSERGDRGERGEDRGQRRRERRDRRRSERGDEASLGEAAPAAAAAVLEAARAPVVRAVPADAVVTSDEVVTSESIVQPYTVITTDGIVSEGPTVVTPPDPDAEPLPISPEPPPVPEGAAPPYVPPVSVAPIAPPPVEAAPRRRSITDPPPADVVDDSWADDDVPSLEGRSAPAETPPAAGEMAGDGATEGEGLDTGWD